MMVTPLISKRRRKPNCLLNTSCFQPAIANSPYRYPISDVEHVIQGPHQDSIDTLDDIDVRVRVGLSSSNKSEQRSGSSLQYDRRRTTPHTHSVNNDQTVMNTRAPIYWNHSWTSFFPRDFVLRSSSRPKKRANKCFTQHP